MKFSIFLDVVKTVNQIQFVIVEEKERQKTNSEWQKNKKKRKIVTSHDSIIFTKIFFGKNRKFLFLFYRIHNKNINFALIYNKKTVQ